MTLSNYNDYPKVRPTPESTNEDLVCFFCKKPAKEINGIIENHKSTCTWRIKKEESSN
jgi:hypothetical protein